MPQTRYWKLPEGARKQLNQDVSRLFREETGVSRTLNPKALKDQPLIHHWLRIRDSEMSKR
jgi:hypothetical protein